MNPSNEGLHPTPVDFLSYIESIRRCTRRRDQRTLYTEYDCDGLLEFLESAIPTASGGNQTPSSNRERSDGFASIYYLNADLVQNLRRPPTPEALTVLDHDWQTYNACGHVILLRGFPSSLWLAQMGHLYHVDWEFWRRHLNFWGTSPGEIFSHRLLPSGSCDIFTLHITTIGSRPKPGTGSEASVVAKLRSDGDEAMQEYRRDLRNQTGWRTGNSIVRGYTVYDSETFTIDQHITIHLNHIDQARNYWQVLVYTDCGDDLDASPLGPWLGDIKDSYGTHEQTMTLPLHWHSEKLIDRTDIASQDNSAAAPIRNFTQNATQLHNELGFALNRASIATDPLYALTDIFRLVSVAERQVLSMIASKLDKDARNILETFGPERDMEINEDSILAQTNIVHHRRVLEEHAANIEEVLAFISRRRKLGLWPSLSQTDEQKMIVQQSLLLTEEDFKHLLDTANTLHARCESAMLIAMNSASIAEARRGVVQARSLFKFTVLASIYVPLSFGSAFMGMNVAEFQNGSVYSVWMFFAVTVPIFGISVLYLFIDWRKTYTDSRNFVIGLLGSMRTAVRAY